MDEAIEHIADLIEEYGKKHMTHPNDSVKLFAASRLVDDEIIKRMRIINEGIKKNGTIFVGHCGGDSDTDCGKSS